MGGVLLDLVVGDRADADGAQGRVALGPVELLAVRLAVARGDLQGVVGGDAGGDAGQGRVALNPVLGVAREGRARARARMAGSSASVDFQLRVMVGNPPGF